MRRDSPDISFDFSIRVIQVSIFLAFIVIVVRLWNLQITNGEMYKELSTNNRIRRIVLPAPRGNIYDRNGAVLADTRPSFDLEVFLEDIKDIDTLAASLAPIISIEAEKIKRSLKSAISDRTRLPYIPYTIKKDLNVEEVVQLEENNFDLTGVSVTANPVRSYTHGELTSHAIGYIGKISKAEYEMLKDDDYTRNELIGKTGIEKTFENYLRGINGGRMVQINNRNVLDKTLGQKDPVQGDDVYLTIDIDIQKKIAEAFGEHKGACVLMDVHTGEVLAYLSRPGYDANLFSTGSPDIGKFFVDENAPLIDRVINGEYAPGSTFKAVVALAALKEKVVTADTSVLCTGTFSFGGIRFKCWKKYGHGEVNLRAAIEQSCNVYFYNMGKELGWEPIFSMASNFSFGRKTGIIFDWEKKGILPSDEWKRRTIGEPWYKGETINYAIGQGYLVITPLQLAVYIAQLANGGQRLRPLVEKRIISHDNLLVQQSKTEVLNAADLDPNDLSLVRDGLFSVVNTKSGTGKNARMKSHPDILVAGKTGTAQASLKGEKVNHSWFMCYAPFENPIVACAVLVELTDSGAQYAAPIARVAMESYFDKYPYKRADQVSSEPAALTPEKKEEPAPQ